MSDSIEELEQRLALATRRADQIDLGVRLSHALLRSDTRAALAHAKRAAGIARARRADDEVARTHIQIGHCFIALAEYQPALESYSTAFTHATRADEPGLVTRAQLGIGIAHSRLGARAKARRALNAALEIAVAHADRSAEATILNAMAAIASSTGDYLGAFEACQRSLAICEELGDMPGVFRATNNIGVIHLEISDLERALDRFRQCEVIARELADPQSDMTTHDNLGSVLQQMRRFEESRAEFELALEIARRVGAPALEASCIAGIGAALNAHGDHELALAVLGEGLPNAERIGHPSSFAMLAGIAEARSALGNVDEAIVLLERAIDGARAADRRASELDLLERLSEVCERAGQVQRALELHKEAMALRTVLVGKDQQRKILELEMHAAIERFERERDAMRLRTEQLSGEMRSRVEELGHKSLHLVEKDELLGVVGRAIAEVADELPADAAPNMKRLARRVARTNAKTNTFEARFERVHRGFMRTLAGRHPSLTPTELKVSALMKADMTSKEIASILGSSVRTIETHRLRIRRKLALPPDTSMASYLSSL